MFEWLDQEIEAVKTRRFHVVNGPADASLRLANDGSNAALPRSYQEFVLRFGNAKLYKELGYYIVGVRAAPVEEQSKDGEYLYRIGHYQSSNAYFKGSNLHGEGEAPVFEEGKGRLFNVADGFEEWLRKRCKAARAKYNKREWAEVLAGPAPFTAEEQAIIEARQLFTCKMVGVNSAGDYFLLRCITARRWFFPSSPSVCGGRRTRGVTSRLASGSQSHMSGLGRRSSLSITFTMGWPPLRKSRLT